jgi:hypothetical protein
VAALEDSLVLLTDQKAYGLTDEDSWAEIGTFSTLSYRQELVLT